MTLGSWETKLSTGLKELCTTKPTGHCQVILELLSVDGNDLESFVGSFGGKMIRKVGLLSGVAVDVPFSMLQALAQSERVKKIWLDAKTRVC